MSNKSNTPQQQAGEPTIEGKNTNGKNSLWKELLSWVEVIVIAVVLALLLNNFILVNARVPSGSMENTIYPGDRLMGFRFTYWFSEPKRGDIVVFKYPVNEALNDEITDEAGKAFLKANKDKTARANYIKRIIGLPGETVEIRDAKIYINGSEEPLDEPYLKETWTVLNNGHFEVPENCYLMLGDNRNNSSDARYWKELSLKWFSAAGHPISEERAESLQYVDRSLIQGKAYFRYWPLTKFSSLY